MSYLIDTDHVIDHLHDQPAVVALLNRLTADGIAISIVTYMEVYDGTLREPDPHAAQEKFHRFLAGIPVLPFSEGVAETCARLRHNRRTQGKHVNSRALDLMVAATALHYGLSLVTRNMDDYEDIPGLALYQTS